MYIRVKKSYLECYSKSFTLYSKKLLKLAVQYPALSMISVEWESTLKANFCNAFGNQEQSRLKTLVEAQVLDLLCTE